MCTGPFRKHIFAKTVLTFFKIHIFYIFLLQSPSSAVLTRRRFSDSHQAARLVLQQAVKSCAADSGDAEFACTRLMRFERELGTLEQFEDSQKRVETRMRKVNKRIERRQVGLLVSCCAVF